MQQTFFNYDSPPAPLIEHSPQLSWTYARIPTSAPPLQLCRPHGGIVPTILAGLERIRRGASAVCARCFSKLFFASWLTIRPKDLFEDDP